MILTYKYRLKGKQKAKVLARYAFAANQVWNFCVETQKKTQRVYKEGSKPRWLSQFDLQHLTKGVSKDLKLHAQTINGVCEQFVKSRDLHNKCPKFRASSGPKKKLGWVPFQKQSRQIEGNAVTYLGKTYKFFGSKRRPLPTTAKGGCFVEDALGRWWVTFHVEVAQDTTCGSGVVGVDLGLKTLATLSDGSKVEALQHYRQHEQNLAVAQRAGNKKQAKRIHAKIANARMDHQHKATTAIVKENCLIAVGDVSASNLAKTRMAKSVFDASWSTFRNMLRYKASRHGANYVDVDESFTTQTCSSCGDSASARRPKGIAGLGIREWECTSCGAIHDRDVNAANNILILGLSAQPRVDGSRLVA